MPPQKTFARVSRKLAGVLLHVISLPRSDLGEDAYRFLDFLSEVGASVWQVLPLNQPHADGSPYQCLSAHAGNVDFISLSLLANEGLLTAKQLPARPRISTTSKNRLLQQAYALFQSQPDSVIHYRFMQFCQQQSWLDDYALFMFLHQHFCSSSWNTWPDEYRGRDAQSLKALSQSQVHALNFIKFCQFIFFEQWAKLKAYANAKGIQLLGDLPFFVAYDSADVWANPELFKLNKRGQMTVVAGVPPDHFSTTGQRWGNPHYRWEAMKNTRFAWWVSRIDTLNTMFDMLRIDHFRGLQATWQIPEKSQTAIQGEWFKTPGDALLKTISQQFPNLKLIAEDLGIITPEVSALRQKHNLPSMKILQFAFSGDNDNPYLPHNIEANSVAYTGTHDNDTTLGWYGTLEEHAKQQLHQLLNVEHPHMPYDLVRLTLATESNLSIIPMQDILELDSAHRMNIPGTMHQHNWRWYFNWSQLTQHLIRQFAHVLLETHRMANRSIGMVINHSGVRTGVFQGEKLISQHELPSPVNVDVQGINLLLKHIKSHYKRTAGIDAIGVSLPSDGMAPNNALATHNIFAKLGKSLGKNVTVTSHIHAATYGAYCWAEKPAGGLLYLQLDKDILGGWIDEDKPHADGGGWTMPIGHIIVEANGRPCDCGNQGCLQQYASATGIALSYLNATQQQYTAQEIAELAIQGDTAAISAYTIAAEALAQTLASILKVVRVQTVVIGGDVIGAWHLMQASFDARLQADLLPSLRGKIKIQVSQSNDTTTMLGVAMLAESEN